MKTPFSFFAKITSIIALAGLLIFAGSFSERVFAAASPNLYGATIQDTTQTTVDFVITGTGFDRFYGSGTTTAGPSDLGHIRYNGNIPNSASISGGAIVAHFPIAVGTYTSGGALTVAANTLANASLHNTFQLTTSSIVDNAKPVVLFTDADDNTFEPSSGSPTIKVTFSEPVTIPSISVGPNGGSQTVNNCGDSDGATWCFDYALPSGIAGTETLTVSDANDLASSPNTMDTDTSHSFTISPYDTIFDIVGDMTNVDTTQIEIVIPTTGPVINAFAHSGITTADETDLGHIWYGGIYHPAAATVDVGQRAVDLFFNVADGFQTTPQGDISFDNQLVLTSTGSYSAGAYIPQELITDHARPVFVSGQASNSGGDSPTTQVLLQTSENLQDVDGGSVSHPNFTVKNATTGRTINILGADISNGGDGSIHINLDTSDPDDYSGPLTFSYYTGAEGTQIVDNLGTSASDITDFPISAADSGYSAYGGGDGSGGNPYQISSCFGLGAISRNADSLSKHYVLESDLDCSSAGNSVMIGDAGDPFSGVFDGNGHKITIAITATTNDAGLFTNVSGGTGTVENLWVAGTVDGGSYDNVGGVVGYLQGTITNVKSTVTVTGTGDAYGGLAGNTFAAAIYNSYFSGSVSGGSNVGGVAGLFFGGGYANDYAVGTVHGTGNDVGGIAGLVSAGPTVSHNFGAAAVSGGGINIGGAFGENVPGGAISDILWDITASGQTDSVGSDNTTSGVTGVNPSNNEANYFKNDFVRTPLNAWDFSDVWEAVSGQYPVLRVLRSDVVSQGVPDQVTGLSATAVSSSEIDLSWTAPSDNNAVLIGYRIERESPIGGGWSDVSSGADPALLTYSDTGLSAGTQYNYRVSAINRIGTGTASVEANATTQSGIGGGAGTPQDPYLISSCGGFEAMNNHLGASFLLTADIECSGEGNAIMIGTDAGPFTGTFDGGGHTVTISLNDSVYSVGLFRRADGATITNVILAGVAQGFSSVGALVGWASNTTISYVGSSAAIPAGTAGNVGGLVGIDTGGSTISNSYNLGDVTISGDDVGGILGQGNGTIVKNVYASGSISGGNNIGGLIGRIVNGGALTYSFSAAAISGFSDLGSIIGEPNTVFTRENYFDATASTIGGACYGNVVNDPYCNPENVGGGDPTYFKNNSSSTPLVDWDFINIWTTTSTYPVFQAPIHVVPSKVVGLTHTSETSDSVSLSWDAPMYNIDAITDYVIEYTVHGENSWSTFLHDTSTSTTAMVTGLSASTDYDFRVSAVNSIGTGLASDTTEDTTSGGGGGTLFAGGDGSSGSPYQIASCDALAEANAGLSLHYILNADIDCSLAGNAAMIGSSASPFTGTFDGQGHTITVSINDPIHDVGLFGATDGATITNVRLAGSVTAVGDLGALVGYADNHTTISFVGSIANVTDDSVGGDAGGLVGQLIGGSSISNSYSRGTVSSGGSAVGGLVGYMTGGATVDRSYAVGSVTGSTSGSVGGLIGYNFEPSDSASNSFSAGAVTGSGLTVAGFFGYTNGATLTNDYFDANRSGQVHCAGYNGDQCTAVNADGLSTGYFLNSSSSAPLDTWDFTNIWVTTDDYPVLRSDAHSTAVSVSITTPADGSVALSNHWNPAIDWGTATTCQYAYGSDDYTTITCGDNGSDIPAPTGSDFASVTLHVKGAKAGSIDATASSTFFYYQTAQTTPAGGPDFTWTHQSGWSGGIALHMARSADGSKVITVPDSGDLHTSTDGGVSWTDQTGLGSHTWTSVAVSATGQYMLAAVHGGNTYLSSDGGSSWTDVETLGGPGLMSYGAWVGVSGDGKHIYIAGSGYNLYVSNDFGSTWATRDVGISSWGNLAVSADGKYISTINSGQLYSSSDYGNTFSPVSGIPSGNLAALGMSADGSTTIVGGWHGDVSLSKNFGSTWTDETALGDHFWYGFGLSADGSVIAAGVNYDSGAVTGPMYISTDGGTTFTAQTNIINDNWQSFGVSADGTQVLAFGNGSGLSSLGSSGGGGGGGGGGSPTTGFAKITVKDISGNVISGATVETACPSWAGFSAFGTTDGSGIVEANPCGGSSWPLSIRVNASGHYQAEQDWLYYSNTVDPENEMGGATDNQYTISLIPTFDGAGSGSLGDPYIITTCAQLEGIQGDLTAHYRFNSPNDIIDCTGIDFQPIGQGDNNGFTGVLEGLGRDSNDPTTIENVTINQPNQNRVGIFAYTGSGAAIRNLHLVNGSVTGLYDIGSLIGYADGDITLDGISSNFSIGATDDYDEGGLIGNADFYGGSASNLSNLTYTGTIDVPEGDIGGIVGYVGIYDAGTHVQMNNDTISGGTIGSTTGNAYSVGGLIGYAEVGGSGGDATALTIDNANVSSTVSVNSGYDIGGLIGNVQSYSNAGGTGSIVVTNSTASGNVSGNGYVGGLVGGIYAYDSGGNATVELTGNTVTGNVTGTQGDIGGLVGQLNVYSDNATLVKAIISGNHAIGHVTGQDNVGGFIGGVDSMGPGVGLFNESSTGGLIVNNNYATGQVTGDVQNDGGSNAGGFIGYMACQSANSAVPYACVLSSNYATGNVSGRNSVGGFVGQAQGDIKIQDAYATGAVHGNQQVGGFAGLLNSYNRKLLVTRVYSRNSLSVIGDSSQNVGGLVGEFDTSEASGILSHSFSVPDLDGMDGVTNVGWVVGLQGSMTPSDVWYAPHSNADVGCIGNVGDASAYCTGPEIPFFFRESSTNGPLHNWDFSTIWVSHSAPSGFPTLTGTVSTVPDDSGAPAPTVVSTTPAGGAINQGLGPITVTFSVPMDTGSVEVAMSPCDGSCPTFDKTWNDDHTVLTITATGGTFAVGTTYSVDVTGNSADGNVPMASHHVFGFTTVASLPVLTEVTPIAAQVTAANAVYTFAASDDIATALQNHTGEYQFTALSGVSGHSVSVRMNPTNHTVSFTGLQAGDNPEVSFSFVYIPSGAESNTLHIGPFLVIPTPASGGGGGGGGSTGGSLAGVAGCPSGFVCVPSTGNAGNGKPTTLTAPSAPSSTSAAGSAYHFPRTIKTGVKPGDDILKLQQFLNTHGFPIAKSGTGSVGHETRSFGPSTKKALIKFQKANKIKANGILGPQTRAAIEKIMNGNK